MNSLISRSLFYYPATFLKGEPIPFLLKGYTNRQWQDPDRVKDFQLKRLKIIVDHAFSKSEFYKKSFADHGFHPSDLRKGEDIKLIPTIDKATLIAARDQLLTSRLRLFDSNKTTGGSTGQPVCLAKNPMALARERCATWRGYEWAGVEVGDSQLRLWGVPHSETDMLKSRITDLISNRRRISAFNLTDESMHQYYELAIQFRPSFLYGYVSAIVQFCNFIKRKKLPPLPSVKSVVTTSEVLSDVARKAIESILKVKVFNEYGCGEVGSIAHECEHGQMHIMADNLIVETDSEPNEPGEIIVTDLFNVSLPLIRYRLGDYATLTDELCPCGRTLPVVKKIHGRAYDILVMPDGRHVHPESAIYIFENIQKQGAVFSQFQVVQESPTDFKVIIVPGKEYSDRHRQGIIDEFRKKLDRNVKVDINLVENIAREASGKMRVVKRNFQN
ncbi:phenylacetate--CoA ligase family protein [Marinobacter sp.]|uniref:phenylacetate--CoA ligase family protein n=1 Tax=Marinobacter sp. TaxID=50741 RepID=UPI0035C6D7BE